MRCSIWGKYGVHSDSAFQLHQTIVGAVTAFILFYYCFFQWEKKKKKDM
jgi:hypothetical protein